MIKETRARRHIVTWQDFNELLFINEWPIPNRISTARTDSLVAKIANFFFVLIIIMH